ncbi:MAG: polysaccharide deacetylase family protein [Myxococcaceae bacterium]|jgi:peptidoglycan/xylan/chitin deacetylase (PgdA/CDA1 family)|nr:polysaccharide deacetylase family protein [Myxococcaceae bacterium]
MLITCYHHVGEPPASAPHQRTWVSQQHLAAQVELLARRGYAFVTASEAAKHRARKVVCLSFDDGFADVLEALPVLEAFGAVGTAYVVTSEIGQRDRAWDGGHRTAFATAAQLQHLASRGWEIGSHADQHVRLAGQPEKTQRASLEASRERLEHLTGRPPRSLAYPYASYDEGTLVAAKALGFTSAVRLGGGLNDERTDALQLNRVGLCGHRWWERLERLKLAWTLRGWYPRRRPPSLTAPA